MEFTFRIKECGSFSFGNSEISPFTRHGGDDIFFEFLFGPWLISEFFALHRLYNCWSGIASDTIGFIAFLGAQAENPTDTFTFGDRIRSYFGNISYDKGIASERKS
ncbi:MAG: hypothetical protein WCJ45_09060 [bacterium]